MKANPDKHTLKTSDIFAKFILSVTLLGITIGSKLNFKEHINNIIQKKHIINYML